MHTDQRGIGRLYALDLARFMAMIGMMQGHVLDALVLPTELNIGEFPWNIWHVVRGFTAPVFLMVSGAVHAFASKRDTDGRVLEDVFAKRIRWAITILGIGYLLVFPANRVWDLPFIQSESWTPFFAVNILQLTGVTMLLFVVVMRTTHSVRAMGLRGLVAGIAILAVTPLMVPLRSGELLPPWLTAYLNTSVGSLFPVFPFSAFLFFGIAVGAWLYHIPPHERDTRLRKHGWRIGAIIVIAMGLVMFGMITAGVPRNVVESPGSVPLAIGRIGVVLIFFSMAEWVLQHTWSMREWYGLFGRKSLYIYVLHLILLFGTPWWNGIGRTRYQSMHLWEGAVIAVIIIIATMAVAYFMERVQRRSWTPQQRAFASYLFMAVLGYLLLV
jgi:uncharacterized membrane protein